MCMSVALSGRFPPFLFPYFNSGETLGFALILDCDVREGLLNRTLPRHLRRDVR